MKADIIPIEVFIKLFLIVMFISLSIISNNDFYYKPYYKNIQYDEKLDVAILGGSNVMYGVSARLLLNNNYVRNYSIPNEGRAFSRYVKWVSLYLDESPVLIYSSIDFWILSENSGELDVKNQFLLPYRPIIIDLYLHIKSKMYSHVKTFNRKFDNYGDMLNNSFKCNNNVKVFDIDRLKGGISDSKINDFRNRIETLKETFHSDKIILRVPPLYINKKDLFVFKAYINNVLSILKRNELNVIIPNPVLYFDNKFVCNAAHHPTSEMREILTKDLFKQLDILRKH